MVEILGKQQAPIHLSQNGTDLHAACSKFHPLPPAWIDGATHNNLETTHSVAYMRAFRQFLKHLLATQPNSPTPKPGGWFDWIPNVGATTTTQTTQVEPNVAASNTK